MATIDGGENGSVKEICDNVALARELAALSNYENAIIYYQGSLQLLSKFILQISDPIRKGKWQQVSSIRDLLIFLTFNNILQMQLLVSKEYQELKDLKVILDTLQTECSGDIPIGVRRRDLPPDLNHFNIPSDPDVWPAPTPVDHGSLTRPKAKPVNSRRSDFKKGQMNTRASSSNTSRRSDIQKTFNKITKKEERPSSSKSER